MMVFLTIPATGTLLIAMFILRDELVFVGAEVVMNSDSELYTDEVYHHLAAEYQDDLPLPVDDEDEKAKSLETSEKSAEAIATTESYAEMSARLDCDNPWFWNAFKCTWLDVKAKNVIKRTETNAKTCAWILGSGLTVVTLWTIAAYCVIASKLRNRLKMLQLREKYTPGRLELPSGKVVRFQPTEDEIKAYEDLLKAIIIQEIEF